MASEDYFQGSLVIWSSVGGGHSFQKGLETVAWPSGWCTFLTSKWLQNPTNEEKLMCTNTAAQRACPFEENKATVPASLALESLPLQGYQAVRPLCFTG